MAREVPSGRLRRKLNDVSAGVGDHHDPGRGGGDACGPAADRGLRPHALVRGPTASRRARGWWLGQGWCRAALRRWRRTGSARRCGRASTPRGPSVRIGIASLGKTLPTAVANANAEAEWPEGNEVLLGMGARRAGGTSLGSGRRRRLRGLIRRLATAEVTASDAIPWAAASRPRLPRVAARIAAEPSQSRE